MPSQISGENTNICTYVLRKKFKKKLYSSRGKMSPSRKRNLYELLINGPIKLEYFSKNLKIAPSQNFLPNQCSS